MSRVPCAPRPPHWLAAIAAGLLLPCAGAQDGLPLAPVAPSGAVMRPVPGVRIQYEPLAGETGVPGAGQLDGALDTGAGTLRGGLRIDPAAQAPLQRLDANWEARLPGPWKTLVLGETHGSGGGWSRPVALAGLRFGRPLALRAPPPGADTAFGLPASTAPAASWPPGFAQPEGARLRDVAGMAAQDTRALLRPGSLSSGPPVRGPELLQAGATDYEVELGRLRDQPGAWAAAAWRMGLRQGLTAEARSEWMDTRVAHGLELVQSVAGAKLHASVAQSAGPSDTGLRWATGLAQGGEGGQWSLGWDGSERGYSPAGGGSEARAAWRAATRWPLGDRASADLSYTRSLAWDAGAADSALKLAAQLPLARRASLSVGLSLQDGVQAGWGAALSLSLPLQP